MNPITLHGARTLGLLIVAAIPITGAAQEKVFSPAKCGALPEALHRNGSVVMQNRLYVLGGQTHTGHTTGVLSAPIGTDSKLGQWRKEAALPNQRSFIGSQVATANDCVYIVGGTYVKG